MSDEKTRSPSAVLLQQPDYLPPQQGIGYTIRTVIDPVTHHAVPLYIYDAEVREE